MRALIILLVALISASASAETLNAIPDLKRLVSNPTNGTYILVCAKDQRWAEDGGYQVVSRPGSAIKLVGFSSLELILMVQPHRFWDAPANKLLVHLCIEEETTYTIDAGRLTKIPRDTDPGKILGPGYGERSFIPQKAKR